MATQRRHGVHGAAGTFREIVDQLSAVGDELIDLAAETRARRARRTPTELAQCIIRTRRARLDPFDDEWFGEAAWDILLETYVAQLAGQPIATGVLSDRAVLAPTTVLRWLDRLESYGLVIRERANGDNKRVYLRLSQDAIDRLEAVLASLSEGLTE